MKLIRFDKEKHYNLINMWWKEHKHNSMERDSLSPFGFIVYNNNTPICASFLYIMAGCNLGQIAWTTTNPKAGLKEKYNAINFCIEGLLALANHYNIKNIISLSNSKGLTKLIQKKNFRTVDKHTLLCGGF